LAYRNAHHQAGLIFRLQTYRENNDKQKHDPLSHNLFIFAQKYTKFPESLNDAKEKE
jgi:hypothetical protein